MVDLPQHGDVTSRTIPERQRLSMRKIMFYVVTVGVLFTFGAVNTARGQQFPGRVTGQVRDEQGAVIAQASVKLTNPATGLERSAVSNDSGEFSFAELSIGSFELTVSKA